MKLLQGTVLSLALIFIPVTAQAVTVEAGIADGNVLLDRCSVTEELINKTTTSTEVTFKVGYCYAWVGSALVYMWNYGSLSPILHACFPATGDEPDVTTDQGIRILVKYLKDHPERLHEHPTILTNDAFREAFPCPDE